MNPLYLLYNSGFSSKMYGIKTLSAISSIITKTFFPVLLKWKSGEIVSSVV
jgi:hypothetical protein